jgi:hypothetical protein
MMAEKDQYGGVWLTLDGPQTKKRRVPFGKRRFVRS